MIAEWRQHLEDYAITPLLDQVNLPILTLKPEWQKETQITAYQGYVFTQAKFSGKMNQWGYRRGSVEDGGYIYDHHLSLTEANLWISLNHTRMPAWMELNHEIALDQVKVYALGEEGKACYGVEKQQAIDPQKLSPTTLSMLLMQLQELAQSGDGYQKDWQEL